MSPSAYRTTRYEWTDELTAKTTQNVYSRQVRMAMAGPLGEPSPNRPAAPPAYSAAAAAAGSGVSSPAHSAATHRLGGLCRSGPSTAWGAHACTWPYAMIQAARNAPTPTRDHPTPDAGSRRKKGRVTSNHMSRDANRAHRAAESTPTRELTVRAWRSVTPRPPGDRPRDQLSPTQAQG